MDRQTATAVVIAAIGVLAVALAAATLTAPVTPQSGADGDGGDGGDGVLFDSPPTDNQPAEPVDIPFLQELRQLVLLVIALAVAGYVVVYRREAVPILVAIVALVGLVWVIAQFGSGTFTPPEQPMEGPTGDGVFGGGEGGDGSGADETTRSPVSLPALLVVLFGIAAAGVLLAVGRDSTPGTGLFDRSEDTDADDDLEPQTRAIGRAAGRAADRIEERGDGDNDVYRAWREMTAQLSVSDPETTSPREFADAAVDAGMAADDVRELTRLFEDVRYGGYSPTAEREQRAVRVFRRIEAAYTGDDA